VRAISSVRADPSARDVALWLGVVTLGMLVTAIAVASDLKVGVPGAPFTGDYRFKVEIGTVLAPGVALAVVAASRSGRLERLPWTRLLLLAYVAALLWSLSLALVDGGNGLASPVTSPDEYLADVPAVGDDPVRFVDTFVDRAPDYSAATRTHPPGAVLLLWALGRAGWTRPLTLGVLITALGCLTVPFVAIAVRSLCGELASRRLLPALVLAPYAVWVAVSLDGVTAALCAMSIACGVLASEAGRTPRWAITAGVLLGIAALFSYAAGWLATIPLIVCFMRRRGTTIALMGTGALVPLGAARLMGFVWPDGLTAAQVDWSERIGPNRSWLVWAVLDLVMLAIACGPTLVPALRTMRVSPGWPFVAGAAVAVAFAVGSGLSRGEVERSWLPFFPWLLVPAVAAARGEDPPRIPPLLLAVGAAAAIVIESILRSTW
jgi:hypothetical protein